MKIFIGFETEYPEAFEVCAESIRQYNPNHEIHTSDKVRVRGARSIY